MGYTCTVLCECGLCADYFWCQSFWGMVDIGLISGSTLGAVVGYVGELELWFLCGTVISVSALIYLRVFSL